MNEILSHTRSVEVCHWLLCLKQVPVSRNKGMLFFSLLLTRASRGAAGGETSTTITQARKRSITELTSVDSGHHTQNGTCYHSALNALILNDFAQPHVWAGNTD